MKLSEEFVTDHINRWRQQLDQPRHPYRKHWPRFLFHHAPIENALGILISNALRSRNDPLSAIPRDVAAREVLATNTDAHDYVRFYFRPGTPTQYNIEGIRALGECKYGEETHCPVLVMFAFDAQSILTSGNVMFSDGNMQSHQTTHSAGEDFFSTLPFSEIYHVGPCDPSVTRKRCAEVLAPSPVTPTDSLKAIFFRSNPERSTFLHMLGGEAARWSARCYVSDALKTFDKRFSFAEQVLLKHDGVGFSLNHRSDMRKISVALEVLYPDGSSFANQSYKQIAAKPPIINKFWKWGVDIPDGTWLVRIHVNGHLAYLCAHTLGSDLF
jgi:hypothetical protein